MKKEETKKTKIAISLADLRSLILQYAAKTYPEVLELKADIFIGSTCLSSNICDDYKDFCTITSETTKVTP